MLTDSEILEQATIDYQFELDRGLSLGEENYPKEMVVRRIAPDQMFESPVNNTVTLIYHEPDIELKRDKGEVPFKSLKLRERSIVVEKYVDGISEDLFKLRQPAVRAQYAQYAADWAGSEGGVRWTQYKQAWDRLLNGDAATYGLADDGQPFFDASHPGRDKDGADTTFQNLFALAFNEVNLNTVLTEMMEFRTITGLPRGNVWKSVTMMDPQSSREGTSPAQSASFHVFVGPANATAAHDLAKMATSAPSKFAGSFTWSTISELTGSAANYWFVMFLDPRRKPLNFIESGAVLIVKDGYDTEPGRLHGRAEWILRAAWGFTYDRWDVISMSTGA